MATATVGENGMPTTSYNELGFKSTAEPWGKKYPLVASFSASSISVATGVFLTNGIDVMKIRQQLAGNASRNILLTGISIVREEGPLALYKGVVPALFRGVLYGGLRIGLYTPLKKAFGADGEHSDLLRKVAAGMTSGAIAAGVCNPTDLVKTRMQIKGTVLRGPIAVAAAVVKEDGIKGLWKGTTPSMARAALLTASQCATYDEVKLLFVRNLGWEDNITTHLAVSGVAGLVTTTVTAPVDMVKTNMFVHNQYTGPWHCLIDIMKKQGIRGLFKGWGGNWMRQGPMTTAIFVVYEKLRPLMGLEEI